MSSARTKLVSARLTDAEYAAVERAAGADTISAWARTALVHAATPPPPVTPVEWHARGTPVEQDWNTTRPPRRHDEDRSDGAPPPDDHAAAARRGPASDVTSRAERRANLTARWVWDPHLEMSQPWTRSAAWSLTTLLLAGLTGVGIAVSQYLHAQPSQPQFDVVSPALWGALAVLMAGVVPMLADDVALALVRRSGRRAKASRWRKWR